jgi:von Willebrand factor A domain-containing protein 8
VCRRQQVAHAQYCSSGDNTVGAAARALASTAKEAAAAHCEDAFVFIVTDANLRRYGIDPARLGQQVSFYLTLICVQLNDHILHANSIGLC